MKSSIRLRLLIIMGSLVAFVVVFGWLSNSLFLERFYIYSKSDALLRTMDTINQIYNSDDSRDLETELYRMQVEQGIQVMIFGSGLDIRYVTLPNPANLTYYRRTLLGGVDLLGFAARYANNHASAYEISRNYDDRLRTEYLDLMGVLDNGNYVLLRMPVQTITDSVGIANRFLLLTGALCLLLAVFISISLSEQIAKPIRAVEDIARSMSNLDFSRRISLNSRDEIGSLASSINSLSSRLQETIEELRDKNRQLEDDILVISKMDERRKEFLSSVSHELKTPIALIQGYAEALEEHVVTDEENRDFYYHVITDEADKMNALVKKLMNLNNLEAGQDELNLESFDIVALTQSVIQRGKSLPGAENLDFHLVSPEAARVYADDFLIEEVIFNYITNAIHYVQGRNLLRITVREIPEGAGAAAPAASATASPASPTAPATASATSPAADRSGETSGKTGGSIRVEVFNSGSYLNDEDRERVWESFYKADKSRSREYGGSGIGLSVVRAIMELHQCPYGAENIEDGVNFWFELPAG
ncbi:MAG: HAMP domain-containing histidine kinase [Clostridiales bacterium]|nr:HAMP domain-containing histidine kinase [Clostridiales bacterium]